MKQAAAEGTVLGQLSAEALAGLASIAAGFAGAASRPSPFPVIHSTRRGWLATAFKFG